MVQLQPADFNGKEMTLKLHKDGKLGGFDTSSGKIRGYPWAIQVSVVVSIVQ